MVYTLGESLLDIIFRSAEQITAMAGGGMLNTSISLGRCGIEVSMISELGDDNTSEFILSFLNENKVNTSLIKKYYHQNTSVAIAHLDEEKVPSFSIYKSYPQKRRLISPKQFHKGDIVVFGSIYALDPSTRHEIVEIICKAKKGGALVIYDPNIRKHKLDEPLLQKAMNENFAFADIIKGSEEDFINVFGDDSYESYSQKLREINRDALFILTLGEKGVIAFDTDGVVELPAKKVDVISTIGAGDAFSAGIVYYIEQLKVLRDGSSKATKPEIEEMLRAGLEFSAEVCKTIDNYIPEPPPFKL